MPPINRELARAKLTRNFHVTGRRPDGYHLIDAEMVNLELADELEISDGDGLEVVDAIAWTGEPTEAVGLGALQSPGNLVVRALASTRRRAQVRLVKRIPRGSGLGGGSADAAAILRWAGVVDLDMAASLGADVPFCLRGGRARVRGIGEDLTSLPPLDLSVALVTPALPISTAAVYAAFDEVGPPRGSESANDLEAAAVSVEPRLKRYRDVLRSVSASEPRLAGSGGTWFVECAREACADLVAEFARRGSRGRDLCCCRCDKRSDLRSAQTFEPYAGTSGYLVRRCQRVRFSIFLCFFLRIRLRRFLMSDPMVAETLADQAHSPHGRQEHPRGRATVGPRAVSSVHSFASSPVSPGPFRRTLVSQRKFRRRRCR